MIADILFIYAMGAMVVGTFSSMWYDLSCLHCYGNSRRIMDLSLPEWAAASVIFWPFFLVAGTVLLIKNYAVAPFVLPVRVVKKVNTSMVNSIEKRIT